MFGLDTTPREAAIAGPAPRHRAVGGWSQARFQRHGENLHLERLDDVVESLDRIVTDEDLRRIVVTGHDAAVPRLREQLPARLSSKLVDVIQLDRSAGEGRILHATLEALRAQDADTGLRPRRVDAGRHADRHTAGLPALVTPDNARASGLQAVSA